METQMKEFYSSFADNMNINHISGLFIKKSLKKGEMLFVQDSPSELDGIAFISRGLFEGRFRLSTGREMSIMEYRPGDFLGIIPFFDLLPHIYSIMALQDSEVLSLSRGSFNNIYKEYKKSSFFFRKILLINMARELRILNDHLNEFFSEDKANDQDPSDKKLHLSDDRQADEDDYNIKFSSLKDLEIFNGLDDSEIDLLATLTRSLIFEKDQMIFSEGSKGDSVYFIIEGEVRISKFFSGVGEEALIVLKRGDFFGELAFLDPSPRSAYAIANTKTLVYSVSKQALDGLFTLDPKDANRILNVFGYIMSARCRKTINTIDFWKVLSGNF